MARRLQQLGAHALVLSGGFVSKAPMYVMRGEMPIRSMTHYDLLVAEIWCSSGGEMDDSFSAFPRSLFSG